MANDKTVKWALTLHGAVCRFAIAVHLMRLYIASSRGRVAASRSQFT